MYDELVKALRERDDALHNASRLYDSDAEDAAILYKAAHAIEELNQKVEDFESMREISPEAEYAINKHADNLISKLDKLISGSEDKPRWICVSEELPEDKEMVIGFTPCDGFMFVGYHVTSFYHDCDFSRWYIVTAMRSTRKMTKKVTHWMPLPKPPKEEAK